MLTVCICCLCKAVSKIIEEGDYSMHDVYNFDETGLFYRAQPNKTLAYEKVGTFLHGACSSRGDLLCFFGVGYMCLLMPQVTSVLVACPI